MKFSVLLPTRNRLDLLRYAVETIRRQDYDDWEIVVSDNDSTDDIAGYVASLADARIRYVRTDRFLPVTDNWNNALAHSLGDYVIMLGDDDALLPGYFRYIEHLLAEHDPDAIYTGAYHFAYPGVMPAFPQGYLHPYRDATFFRDDDAPFFLGREEARELVDESLRIKMRFAYNMQFLVISRRLIEALRDHGPFFQPPYPDFYATNVIFLTATRLLIAPRPLVVIGISPKSFGYFFFNKREREGVAMLQNLPDPAVARALDHVLLPGVDLNSSWLCAMELIRRNYGQQYDLRVGYARYRFLQIAHVYKNHFYDRRLSREQLEALRARMRPWERLVYGLGFQMMFTLIGLVPRARREQVVLWFRSLAGQYRARSGATPPTPLFQNILEVFEHAELAARKLP